MQNTMLHLRTSAARVDNTEVSMQKLRALLPALGADFLEVSAAEAAAAAAAVATTRPQSASAASDDKEAATDDTDANANADADGNADDDAKADADVDADAETDALKSVGLRVRVLDALGSAVHATLNVGDIVTAIDGCAVATKQALHTLLRNKHLAGDTVAVSVIRCLDGRADEVPFEVGMPPSSYYTQSDLRRLRKRAGVSVAESHLYEQDDAAAAVDALRIYLVGGASVLVTFMCVPCTVRPKISRSICNFTSYSQNAHWPPPALPPPTRC
jgi:hypothetical protein